MIRNKIFMFFALISFYGIAQQQMVQKFNDSISNFSLKELDNLSIHFERKNDTAKAILTAKKLILKSRNKDNHKYHSRGYYSLVVLNKDLHLKESYVDSMLTYAEKAEVNNLLANGNYLKGNIKYYKGEYRSAMELLSKAYRISLKDYNTRTSNKIETRMASIKNVLGRFYEANVIYKKAYNEYNSKKIKTRSDKARLISSAYNLSLSFSYLKQYDSTLAYVKRGKYLIEEYNLRRLENRFVRSEAIGNFGKGNIDLAIQQFKISNKNISNHDLAESYFYLGQLFKKKNLLDSTIYYYLKSDSILSHTKTSPFIGAKRLYKNLYNEYKKKNDLPSRDKYLKKFFKLDSVDESLKSNISDGLHKLYDLPRIKANQELADNRKIVFRVITLSVFIALIMSLILLRKKKRELKKQKLIVQKYLNKESDNLISPVNPAVLQSNKKSYINDETTDRILALLEDFEENKKFLDKNITQESLSKEMLSNSTNLSKIINTHKGVNFSTYMKTLRIKYALEMLQSEEEFLKYSIGGLAEEFGFSNPDSFSRAFKEITKVKPSVFMDELKKHRDSSR